MNRHVQQFKELIIDRPLEEIADTLEYDVPKQAIKKAVSLLLAGLGAMGLLVLVLALIYAARGTIRKMAVLLIMGGVLLASYCENHKSTTGPAGTKEPTIEQYITVGNIVKIAAKRVAPMLELSPIYDETDIKAAKDERIVKHGKCRFLKYRLFKKNIAVTVEEGTAQRVFQSELQTSLDNDNPAGFDKVRFLYGGVDECILQVDRVTQSDLYVYIYVCYASADYFSQREQERGNGQHDTTDADVDF